MVGWQVVLSLSPVDNFSGMIDRSYLYEQSETQCSDDPG